MRSIVLLFTIVAFFLGVYSSVHFGAGLERFDGIEYLPRVTALEIASRWGPTTATWCALLASVRELHDGGSLRRSATACAIAIVGYPVACLLSFAGAFLAWRAWYGDDVRAYLVATREHVQARDLGWSLASCALSALIIAVALIVGRQFWTSTRYGARRKLAAAAGGFLLIQWGLRILSSSSFVDGS